MIKKIFLIFAFVSILVACSDGVSDKSEGVIDFSVTYPKINKNIDGFSFYPTEMKMYFKQDKQMTSLAALGGVFKTNFVCKRQHEDFFHMVKLMSEKYVLELKGNEITLANQLLPKHHIEFVDSTKEILGFMCKKAIVTIENETNDAFTVFYTDAIRIENPNWCNQFAPINGVMLEYQYEKYDICMRFKATKITFEKVNDIIFEIPVDYQHVSALEIEKKLNDIFDNFN